MALVLEDREYQQRAAAAGAQFLMGKRKKWNGIIVAPTGCGKSHIIAMIVSRLDGPCIVIQPSKEILEQNMEKLQSYGHSPAIYSASKNRKEIGELTLITVASVRAPNYREVLRLIVAFMLRLPIAYRNYAAELFEGFPYVIVDEADLVNPAQGMYKDFLDYLASLDNIKVLGLTATPYRMASNSRGTELRFITRTVPRVFNEVVFWIQNKELFEHDPPYLAKLKYYPIKDSGFEHSKVQINSNGSDYDQKSLQLHLFETSHFKDKLAEIVERLIRAGRRNVLVFVQFVRQAEDLVHQVPGARIITSDTKKSEREAILRGFKAGDIKVVVNVNVLSIGFDFPQLECIVLAAPTLSLRRYYQRIGRLTRPHPDKVEAWVVDLVGTYAMFGKVEDLMLYCQGTSQWYIAGRPGGSNKPEKRLTNVYLQGDAGMRRCPKCKSTDYFPMRHEQTGANAMLSRPKPGGKANIVLRKTPEGKTVYAIPKPDEPDYHLREFVSHYAVCPGKRSE